MQTEILYSRTPLTPVERAVWNHLSTHARGRKSAVKKKRLVRVIGVHERAIREAVKSLIEHHALPICSSPTHPAGYYVPVTPDEIAEACKVLHGGALSLLYREKCLKGVSSSMLSRQVEIDLVKLEKKKGANHER